MRKSKLAPWALAAVIAVALPGAHSAWAAPSSATLTKMLNAQLPPGETLARASIADTAKALGAAARENPDKVTSLTQAAILAKTPKKGQLSCSNLDKLVNAATTAVPAASSDIVQTALSMHPECADSLNELVTAPGHTPGGFGNSPDGYNTPQDLYGGFGVGFGAGFPGSPGFTGSPPSGASAVPIVPPPVVTSVQNG